MAPLLQTLPIVVAAFGGGGTMSAGVPFPQEAPASGSPVLSLYGDHRTRYERLRNQFRADLDGVASALMLRTRVSAELDAGHFTLRAELQDSRSYLADSVAAVTTSMVNPLELLQAHIEIPLGDRSGRGSRSVLRAANLGRPDLGVTRANETMIRAVVVFVGRLVRGVAHPPNPQIVPLIGVDAFQ